MKKRKLRNLEVSAIGYGCMGLSHGYGKLPERKEAVKLIQYAFDLGCTFFDTAEGYGLGANEELLGEALTNIRSKAVIATKLHIRNEGNLKEQIEKRLDASLKRLRTDYVDLYYQHRVNPDIPVEEIAGIMGELIHSGKILGWGQSQATADEIRRANSVTPLTAIQSEYSIMERMFEKENVAANQPLLDMLMEFAAQKNATPAQISLAWILHKKEFIVPIPGMRSMERMRENFGAAEITLSENEYQQIENRLSGIAIHGNRTDEDIAKLRKM